jgi:hypothetical protein
MGYTIHDEAHFKAVVRRKFRDLLRSIGVPIRDDPPVKVEPPKHLKLIFRSKWARHAGDHQKPLAFMSDIDRRLSVRLRSRTLCRKSTIICLATANSTVLLQTAGLCNSL